MKMITLVENTCDREDCTAEHGLSIYVETKKHRLLLDAGQTDAVVKNAEKIDVDLSLLDTVVLSHGHYDHSGGILPVMKLSKDAKIIMRRTACEPHYNGDRYIGIDTDIAKLPNVMFLDGDMMIDDELFIFGDIRGRRCFPQSNRRLLCLKDGVKIQDDFSHEQCLVVTQNDERWLLSGCAHSGILNVLDRYKEIFGSLPDHVVSGFHMMKREGEYTEDEKAVIAETAHELAKTDIIFHSGHCTGEAAFNIMKEIMGDRLRAIHSGSVIAG